MRTIRNQAIPQDGDDVKFPDGQIRNETDIVLGTPVVREIYGDIVTNVYAILRNAGITPNQEEDSSTSSYQLLDALKVFSNNTNDKKQILTVNSANPEAKTITLGINLENLPENYVLIGQLTEQIVSGEDYTVIGANASGGYDLTPDQTINASAIVLLVIHSDGCTILNLKNNSAPVLSEVQTPFGAPLSFNESNNVYYLFDGNLINNTPLNFNIQDIIREDQVSASINVIDGVLHKDKFIFLTFNTVTLVYQLFSFDINDLTQVDQEIVFDATGGVDNQIYMFCDGVYLYFTNSQISDGDTILNNANNSVNDNDLTRFVFDPEDSSLTLESGIVLSDLFEKTTNTFINNGDSLIYTFIDGYLVKYEFNGNRTDLVYLNTVNGVVFKLNGATYYSNGSRASLWVY